MKRNLILFETEIKDIDLDGVLSLCRRACGHVDEGTCPHQVLAATLTLSQPGGADYAHSILVSTPSFESHRRACLEYCYVIFKASTSISSYSLRMKNASKFKTFYARHSIHVVSTYLNNYYIVCKKEVPT